MTAAAPLDLTKLRDKSLRGGLVMMGVQAATLGIQLASTVILARLLTPDDYGVLAMVLAVTVFAGLFNDLGLSSASIQAGQLSHAQQSNLFWLNVCVGMALTVLVALCAPLVASLYGNPLLTDVTRLLSLTFLLGGISSQHGANLYRTMNFPRRGLATVGGLLIGLLVSVVLALRGQGYWALAWGTLATSAATTVLLLMLSGFRPMLPRRGTNVANMVRFGVNVTGFSFVNYFHRNLDNILLGRYWGADVLGLYSRAYMLVMLPIAAIRTPLETVAFPAMSKLRDCPEAYRQYYRRIVQGLAYLSMPTTAFLAVASTPLILIALGEQWLGVVPIFVVLAVTSFIQPVAGLRGLVFLSSGRSSELLVWGIFNTLCVCAGFAIGIRWGAIGIAASYAIVNYLILHPSLVYAFRNTPLKLRDFYAPIVPPATASLVALAITKVAMECDVVCPISAPWSACGFLGAVFVAAFLIVVVVVPGGWQSVCEFVRLYQVSLGRRVVK